MLAAAGKASLRVWSTDTARCFKGGRSIGFPPPMGPVSVEIPIDVQKSAAELPANIAPLPVATKPDEKAIPRR